MKNRCKENPCCGDPHSCTLHTRPAPPRRSRILLMIDNDKSLARLRAKLPPREKIIFDRLTEGPTDRRELASLITGSTEHSKSMVVQVSVYIGHLRKKLEPIGYTIPRNDGGNAHFNREIQLIKLP